MKKVIYVVVDWETRRAVKAFTDEEKANDFGDDLYLLNGKDNLVTEIILEED